MTDHPFAEVADNLATVEQQLFTAPQERLPELCLHTAKKVITACRANPDAALAYIKLVDSSATSSFSLRACITVTSLGILQRTNEHTLQHILAALVAVQACADKPQEQAFARLRPLSVFCRQRGLEIWSDLLTIRKALVHPDGVKLLQRPTLSRWQQLGLVATYLARHLARQSLYGCFKPLATVHTSAPYQAMLGSLLKSLSEVSPGSWVNANNQQALVLAVSGNHTAIQRRSELSAGSNGALTGEHQWVPTLSLQPWSAAPLPFHQWWQYYCACQPNRDASGPGAFPVVFPVNRPPSSLLKIIDALQLPDTDISELSGMVEREPVFSQFLREAASNDNRLQLPVGNVKQAILTYGTERVGDMLTQRALSQRLTQHQFPLLAQCQTLAVVAAGIAGLLSTHTRTRFTSQSAALVTSLLCAPLFMLPALKVMTTLPFKRQAGIQMKDWFTLKESQQWPALVSDLAQGWHQSPTWRALLHHAGKHPDDVPRSLRKEHALLLLSVVWARSWLFANSQAAESVAGAITASLDVLSLQPDVEKTLRHDLAPQLLCPLVN
ncbi:HDOD domain-containing protein [Alteromonas sp. ASW11-19]|uniref:HDOD domain-containing protein n=1 Tax=Alteromonas salexigens TaxID=2982530 RepID=A0ABT2VR67_9ALTE|nr:HDOD domain-containing protein [Alteromonas salexigens]MCU7554908.1 HDOD domain-containing protein [Alteromonas salexigens]